MVEKKTKGQPPAEREVLRSQFSPPAGETAAAPLSSTGRPFLDREICAGLFASFPEGVSVTNKNGVVVYVNPAFVRITGYDLKDIPTDKQWFHKAFPDPEERREALSVWVKYQTSRIQKKKVFPVACKSGRIYPLEIRLAAATDEGLIAIFTEKETPEADDPLHGQREDKWRLLLDIMNEGFINVNADGVPVFVNQRLCDMLGYTGEEIIGRPLTVFLDEESRDIFKEEFAQRVQGGKRPYEITFLHKNGQRRYFIISPRPLYDAAGRFAGSYAACTDITDRKLMEEELRRSEARYHHIFDNSALGIFQVTPEGRLINANMAAARILGYETPEEMMAAVTDVRTQFYAVPEERDRALAILEREGVLMDFETRCRQKNGSRVWVSINANLMRDRSGRVLCHDGTLQDIDHRKRAEEELSECRQRYEELLAGVREIAWETDAEGRFVYVSPGVTPVLGYHPEELQGRMPWEFLRTDDLDKLKLLIRRFLNNPAPLIVREGIAVHKHGCQVAVTGNGYPFFDRRGTFLGYRGILRDVSPRRDQLIFDIGAKSPKSPRRPADKEAPPRRP